MNYRQFKVLFIIGLILTAFNTFAQKPVQIALLKYKVCGYWYANPTSLHILIYFCNKYLQTDFNTEYETV
jgi:hypothetical protein